VRRREGGIAAENPLAGKPEPRREAIERISHLQREGRGAGGHAIRHVGAELAERSGIADQKIEGGRAVEEAVERARAGPLVVAGRGGGLAVACLGRHCRSACAADAGHGLSRSAR